MDTKKAPRRDSFEIDDGLDGADDFMEEANPFESPFDDTIPNDAPPAYTVQNKTVKPTDERPSENIPAGNTVPEQELGPGLLNYYSRYFQLTTEDLKSNMHESISFRRKPTDEDQEVSSPTRGPNDLYGAIWITATVVLSKFFFLGLLLLFKQGIIEGVKLTDTQIHKLYISIIHGLWLFYSYVFLVGGISYKLLVKVDNQLTVSETISIFGYSLTVWIPISILIEITELFQGSSVLGIVRLALKIFFIFCAFVKSSLYLYSKFGREDNTKYVNTAIVLNAIFCLFSKIFYF